MRSRALLTIGAVVIIALIAASPALGHEHPLKPVCASGNAVWSCPTTGDSYAEIGRLHLEPGSAARGLG
jgi:hypothetical protein